MVAREEAKFATTPDKKQILEDIADNLKKLMSNDPKVIGEMIYNAANRAVNYTLTDKEFIAKTIAEITNNSIFRDGMKWFDLNGYNFDNQI
jgi:cysteine synthase